MRGKRLAGRVFSRSGDPIGSPRVGKNSYVGLLFPALFTYPPHWSPPIYYDKEIVRSTGGRSEANASIMLLTIMTLPSSKVSLNIRVMCLASEKKIKRVYTYTEGYHRRVVIALSLWTCQSQELSSQGSSSLFAKLPQLRRCPFGFCTEKRINVPKSVPNKKKSMSVIRMEGEI